jgi:hypothetical protein
MQDKLVQAALRVDQADELWVEVFSFASLDDLLVTARILLDSGEIKLIREKFTSNPSYTRTSVQIPLTTGWLQTVSLVGTLTPFPAGRAYGRLSIVRGRRLELDNQVTLASGVLSALRPLSWPAVLAEPPTVDDIAVDEIARTTFSVGADTFVGLSELEQIRATHIVAKLTTSATVATRQVHFRVRRVDDTIAFGQAAAAQTASQTRFYYTTQHAQVPPVVSNFIPVPMILGDLPGDCSFETFTTGLQSNDIWSYIRVFGKVKPYLLFLDTP